MSDFSLVYPMLAMVLLTFGVALALFRARLRAIREGHTAVSYFRLLQGSPEPEFLAKPTRHFINLFEMPLLFFQEAALSLRSARITRHRAQSNIRELSKRAAAQLQREYVVVTHEVDDRARVIEDRTRFG